MEVDDLHDVFGTESRVRNASVKTERRVLRQEQQQHYLNFAAVHEGLQAAAEARDMQQADKRAAIVAAQGHLQQVEPHLQGEVELQR